MFLLLVLLSLVETGSLVVAIALAAEQSMMMMTLQHTSRPHRCLREWIQEKQSMTD